MRSRWIIWFVVVGLVLAFVPDQVQADDTSLGAVGFAVMPMENTQIAMAAEWVDVELAFDQSWVTCIFTFTNTGPATDVLMGFPQMQARPNRREAPELRDFRAWVDGREVAVIFRPQAAGEDEERYAGWYTFDVPFAADQTRVVRNTYHGRLTWSGSAYGRSFGYILHTGANWAGPISQANVIVHWGPREVADLHFASPTGYVAGPRELRWHWTNLEPSEHEDVWIDYSVATTCYYFTNAAVSSGSVRVDNSWDPGSLLLADLNPATAWRSVGETAGAWIIWVGGGYTDSTTLGLGIFPGAAGGEYRQHGRPREVLIRLARVTGSPPPHIELIPDSFLHPLPQVEVTEYHLTLDDAPRWQFLHLEKPADYHAFQIVIESVYPGEHYDDVAIAEVLFPVFEEDFTTPPTLPNTGGPTGLFSGLALLLFLGIASLIIGGAIRIWPEIKPGR
jgi:hypothetical protein